MANTFEQDLAAYYSAAAAYADALAALGPQHAQIADLEVAVASHGQPYFIPASGPDPALVAEYIRGFLPKAKAA